MLGEVIFGDTTSRCMAVEKENDLNNFEGEMSALAPESSMDSVSVRAAVPRPSMDPISVQAAAPRPSMDPISVQIVRPSVQITGPWTISSAFFAEIPSMDPISMHAIVQGPRIGAEKPVICADIRSMDEFGLESVHHVTDEPPSRPSPAFANTS